MNNLEFLEKQKKHAFFLKEYFRSILTKKNGLNVYRLENEKYNFIFDNIINFKINIWIKIIDIYIEWLQKYFKRFSIKWNKFKKFDWNILLYL